MLVKFRTMDTTDDVEIDIDRLSSLDKDVALQLFTEAISKKLQKKVKRIVVMGRQLTADNYHRLITTSNITNNNASYIQVIVGEALNPAAASSAPVPAATSVPTHSSSTVSPPGISQEDFDMLGGSKKKGKTPAKKSSKKSSKNTSKKSKKASKKASKKSSKKGSKTLVGGAKRRPKKIASKKSLKKASKKGSKKSSKRTSRK